MTTLAPIPLPDVEHPLFPLFNQYNSLVDVAKVAHETCERMAPTPSTLAEAHPAEKLAGNDAEFYRWNKQRRDDYSHAAEMLRTSITAVVDNLGGM